MKKILFLLMLCLSISAQAVELDHFINPLFYKDIKPYSKVMNDLIYRIMPTSVDTNPKDTDILTSQGDCKLIDQSQTRVLFKCYSTNPNRYNYPDDWINYYLFVSTNRDTERKRCEMKVYYQSFKEIKLDYDIYSGDVDYTYHYVEADDCGVTEEVDPLKIYKFSDDLILRNNNSN